MLYRWPHENREKRKSLKLIIHAGKEISKHEQEHQEEEEEMAKERKMRMMKFCVVSALAAFASVLSRSCAQCWSLCFVAQSIMSLKVLFLLRNPLSLVMLFLDPRI